jgi:hypothetical protein
MADILTNSVLGDWLSDDIQARDDFDRLVGRAERRLIDRYREHRAGTPGGPVWGPDQTVMLDGWAEDASGAPDTGAMPDDLVTRLRDVISRIVEHAAESPGAVKRRLVGSKSVTYKAGADALPRTTWAPLRPYDERTPYSAGV